MKEKKKDAPVELIRGKGLLQCMPIAKRGLGGWERHG